jgi:hypothetical protein
MMRMERSEVQFGLTRIPYAIRRSSRRGTVAVTIDPHAGVVLMAPATAPVAQLDRVVHAKAPWIVEKLRKRSDRPPPLPAREFVNGETFLYLGRQYRLRVERRADEAGENGLRRGWLVVRVPAAAEASMITGHVREALVSWYRTHAAEKLSERASVWAEKLGMREPRVLVREPRNRWGSCDAKGTVRLNWRVIQAPMRLVDYVVAHELVHLQHPDHTSGFWATLGWVMPDYDARKDGLKKLGPILEW